jgi:hypothetical protein
MRRFEAPIHRFFAFGDQNSDPHPIVRRMRMDGPHVVVQVFRRITGGPSTGVLVDRLWSDGWMARI